MLSPSHYPWVPEPGEGGWNTPPWTRHKGENDDLSLTRKGYYLMNAGNPIQGDVVAIQDLCSKVIQGGFRLRDEAHHRWHLRAEEEGCSRG